MLELFVESMLKTINMDINIDTEYDYEIPYHFLYYYIKCAIGQTNTIVDVGCGNGGLAKQLKDDLRNIRIIKVDPNYPADYTDIQSLIKKEPELVGKCCLLVIYPPPTNNRHKEYDMEAVKLMKPLTIVSLTEDKTYNHKTGSGSNDFLNWLNKTHENDDYFMLDCLELSHLRGKSNAYGDYDCFDFKIRLHVKNDCILIDEDIENLTTGFEYINTYRDACANRLDY